MNKNSELIGADLLKYKYECKPLKQHRVYGKETEKLLLIEASIPKTMIILRRNKKKKSMPHLSRN